MTTFLSSVISMKVLSFPSTTKGKTRLMVHNYVMDINLDWITKIGTKSNLNHQL